MHKDCIILCHHINQQSQLSCLQQIGGKPFIEHIANYFKKYHICKVVFSISQQKEVFKETILANRDKFNFAFDFAEQEQFLGTGSAIINALQYSDTPDVLVLNGHTFFDVNLDDLIAWQQTKMGDATLALSYQEQTETYKLAQLSEEHVVTEILDGANNKKGLALGGVYCIFRPSFLNINFPNSFSFEDDFLSKYGKERDFIGMISDGSFIDISLPETVSNPRTKIILEALQNHL